MPASQAMEMLMTGEFIDAQQALQRGLVNRVAPPDQLDAQVEALVAAIVAKPREALALGKALFYHQPGRGLVQACRLAGETMGANMMEPCAQEGVAAFIDKCKPSWNGPT